MPDTANGANGQRVISSTGNSFLDFATGLATIGASVANTASQFKDAAAARKLSRAQAPNASPAQETQNREIYINLTNSDTLQKSLLYIGGAGIIGLLGFTILKKVL